MKTSMTQSRARIVAMALHLAVALAACIRTPQVRYYTLTADGPARPARAEPTRYTVRIGPASVPEMLDRPELVLRISATELAIDDGHRWAEPLRTGIARAVAGDLTRQLDGALVVLAEERTPAQTTDVEVAIDVQRLDARMGDGVTLDVTWVARWSDNRPIHTARSVARAPITTPGRSYDALVAACAQTVATLSNDIAQAVRAEQISRR
jgi:uncharacterized lipoprotein YmbA